MSNLSDRMEAQLERMEAILARLEAVAQGLALPPAGAASSAPVDPEEAKAIDAAIASFMEVDD